MKHFLFSVLGIAVIAGTATVLSVPKAAVAQVAGPRTQCIVPERVLFSCPLKSRKTVSVCKTPQSVTLRYGPLGKPDVVLTSNGKDKSAYYSSPGNRMEQRDQIRFIDGEHSYIVYGEGGVNDQGKRFGSSGLTMVIGDDFAKAKSDDCARAMKSDDGLWILGTDKESIPEEEPNSRFSGF